MKDCLKLSAVFTTHHLGDPELERNLSSLEVVKAILGRVETTVWKMELTLCWNFCISFGVANPIHARRSSWVIGTVDVDLFLVSLAILPTYTA